MHNWQEIYNNPKRLDRFILEMLVKADGFDSPTGRFEVDDWLEYCKMLYRKASIQKGDTVYDVGCGTGAFVYPLYREGAHIGGIDFAPSLVELAKKIMPEGDFTVGNATNMPTDRQYDIVTSHSLFFYVTQKDAYKILELMLKKAKRTIAVFDINDQEKESVYHKERMKTMTKEEYEKKYQGLPHFFYSKAFFETFAQEHRLKITIEDQKFEKYNNAKFRFNVIMHK